MSALEDGEDAAQRAAEAYGRALAAWRVADTTDHRELSQSAQVFAASMLRFAAAVLVERGASVEAIRDLLDAARVRDVLAAYLEERAS